MGVQAPAIGSQPQLLLLMKDDLEPVTGRASTPEASALVAALLGQFGFTLGIASGVFQLWLEQRCLLHSAGKGTCH